MISSPLSLPALMQAFFQHRLVAQRGASAHTIASYRDTFALFLPYVAQRTGRTPSALTLEDLDSPVVLAFLDHLVSQRGNSARTRNLRLTAIRSFLRYASLREPTALAVTQRVLAIPTKRFDRPVLGFLSREEVQSIPSSASARIGIITPAIDSSMWAPCRRAGDKKQVSTRGYGGRDGSSGAGCGCARGSMTLAARS